MADDLRHRYAEAIRRVDAEVAASRHAVYLTDDVILDALIAVRDSELESLRVRAKTAEHALRDALPAITSGKTWEAERIIKAALDNTAGPENGS